MNPAFLARLGLDGSPDLRAIRRAYAVALKKIDQAADPAHFQSLRESYELALAWRHACDLPYSGPAMPPLQAVQAAGHGPQAGEDAVAERALEHFRSKWAALNGAPSARHIQAWRDMLTRCIESDDLLKLEARARFEQQVALWLADGWKPGHHVLFQAAVDIFGWARDRHTLAHLGEVGACLDRAINETVLYGQQEREQHFFQAELRSILLADAAPDLARLPGNAAQLDAMLTTFPTWMAITVDPARIAMLRTAYAAIRAEAQRRGRTELMITMELRAHTDTAAQWRRPYRGKQGSVPARYPVRPEAEGDEPYAPMDGYRLAWRALLYATGTFLLIIFINIMRVLYF